MKIEPNRLFIIGKTPSSDSYNARCHPFSYKKHVDMFAAIRNPADLTQMIHIHEELHFFSDGQLNPEKQWNFEWAAHKYPLEIICSITHFYQLELLMQVIAAARRQGIVVSEVAFIYLFGQRSDRVVKGFGKGASSYFQDVLAPLINALKAPISFFCPHSWLNLHAIDLLVPFEFPFELELPPFTTSKDISLAADEGEYDRAYAISSAMPHYVHGFMRPFSYYVNIRLIMDGYFNKKREQTTDGNLIKTTLENSRHNAARDVEAYIKENPSAPITIYDDMCDGGRTFISAAKRLRKQFPTNPLQLFVAHALFFYRYADVFDYFDLIVTTNSIQRNFDSEEHDGSPGDWGCEIDHLEREGKLFVVDVFRYPHLASQFGSTFPFEKFGENKKCQTES